MYMYTVTLNFIPLLYISAAYIWLDMKPKLCGPYYFVPGYTAVSGVWRYHTHKVQTEESIWDVLIGGLLTFLPIIYHANKHLLSS